MCINWILPFERIRLVLKLHPCHKYLNVKTCTHTVEKIKKREREREKPKHKFTAKNLIVYIKFIVKLFWNLLFIYLFITIHSTLMSYSINKPDVNHHINHPTSISSMYFEIMELTLVCMFILLICCRQFQINLHFHNTQQLHQHKMSI